MDSETKNYELAYLLPSSIAEGEVVQYAHNLGGIIEGVKGMVQHEDTPQKRRFAYPIRKEQNGYFGFIVFRMHPSATAELDKKLKNNEHLLRFMILQRDQPSAPPRPVLRERPVHQAVSAGEPPREKENKDERLDLEALDKRLEEILGT